MRFKQLSPNMATEDIILRALSVACKPVGRLNDPVGEGPERYCNSPAVFSDNGRRAIAALLLIDRVERLSLYVPNNNNGHRKRWRRIRWMEETHKKQDAIGNDGSFDRSNQRLDKIAVALGFVARVSMASNRSGATSRHLPKLLVEIVRYGNVVEEVLL